jgi:hypothetical protein
MMLPTEKGRDLVLSVPAVMCDTADTLRRRALGLEDTALPDMDLTQEEADMLIAMEKHRQNDQPSDYPMMGGSVSVPLTSPDKREVFQLDITRGNIDLSKVSYQNRARKVVPLVRMDLAGPIHTNPDGVDVLCPHIHVYRDGYGMKWAKPLPAEAFSDPSDLWRTLEEFYVFCNITRPPFINRGIF